MENLYLIENAQNSIAMRTNNTNYASWASIIRTQNHLNGTDVINTLSEGGGSWGHDGSEVLVKNVIFWERLSYLVEQQNYVSADKNYSVGYVKNRTYNIKTNGCNHSFDDNNLNFSRTIPYSTIKHKNQFVIRNLKKKTNYYIDWYSYNDGAYTKTDYLKTNNSGGLKLKFPELYNPQYNPDKSSVKPVFWFVVHIDQNNGLIAQPKNKLTEYQSSGFLFQPINNNHIDKDSLSFIYPNPFRDIINVNSLTDDWLVIKTLSGNIVKRMKIKEGKNQMSFKDLSNGLYFFELINQRNITKIEKL